MNRSFSKNQIYFTADLHFGHRNILEYSKRNFQSIADHDTCLIESWNKVVSNQDTVFVLGDIGAPRRNVTDEKILNLTKQIRQLNGKLFLIKGNHDSLYINSNEFLSCFDSVVDYLEINIYDDSNQQIIMSHYPFVVWNNMMRNSWMLYGHVHNSSEEKKYLNTVTRKTMNVGVDMNNYQPFSYTQIKKMLNDDSIRI